MSVATLRSIPEKTLDRDIPVQRSSKWTRILILLYLVSLPLVNPWVHGDGVGYYAYARATLIQRNLHFEKDWLAGNTTFRMGKVDESGSFFPYVYTRTGHLDNHFTVGPAILWSPFLVATHLAVLGYDELGGHLPADGFSWPYRTAMALATSLYGFLGLCLSFCLAREYFDDRWALIGTLGIWLASSLPVYMYFNPSWSHAHSCFAVALFIWYWNRTRAQRTLAQWILLGVLAGLMLNVYYPNVVFLSLPVVESVIGYAQISRSPARGISSLNSLLLDNVLFASATLIAFLPTLITRQIVYGSPFNFGAYSRVPWNWTSPSFVLVLVSSDHGLVSWTPILVLSLVGLFFLYKRDRVLAGYLILATLLFYYLIASYPFWDGLSSFGNRFFLSLVPVFVIGLTASIDAFARALGNILRAMRLSSAIIGLFALWNLAFIFQWGLHLIPVRGPISWRDMAYNQVAVVPVKMGQSLKKYLLARQKLMGQIEEADTKQIESQQEKRDPQKP